MSVSINLGTWGSVFAVPSCVVDEHIKIANESQLKVLLFLLRNSGKSFSESEISDTLKIHIDDVKDCIEFWIDRGVLCKNDNTLTPVKGAAAADKAEEPEPQKKTVAVPQRVKKPDIISAAQMVAADETLQALLPEIEVMLSKPLSSSDVATVVLLYDTCGLPPEVIMMLVNYCISIDKGNMRNIERIGVEWSDNGVNSIEAAENRIMSSKRSYDNWSVVRSAFGLQNAGSPTKKQLEYAEIWVGQWHFSYDMLRTAYELCVDNLGKLSMAYINKVLQRWNNAGIYIVEDIERLDKKKTEKSKSDASYDIDELDKVQEFNYGV